MDTASAEDQTSESPGDLSLRDAVALYDVTARTLAQRLRCGELVGYKTRGAAGREWRVTCASLDAAGYRRRGYTLADASADQLDRLQEDLAAAKRAAAAERRRADDLDRRLGHALLTCGRLRTALAAATGEPQLEEATLDPNAARLLINAVTSGSTTLLP